MVWGNPEIPYVVSLESQVETTLGLFGTEHVLKETPLKPNGLEPEKYHLLTFEKKKHQPKETPSVFCGFQPLRFFVGVCKLIEVKSERFSMDPEIHMLWDFQSFFPFPPKIYLVL